MKAPDVLRKEIKKRAEAEGIFDNRVPSRMYCKIAIESMASLMGVSVESLTKTIEAQPPSS